MRPLFLVLPLLLLCGCGAAPRAVTTPTPTATPRPTATIWTEGPSCNWDAEIMAWLDQNENGMWDADERPFAGLTVSANGERVQKEGKTGTDGRTTLFSGPLACPLSPITIVAAIPPDYRLTTAATFPNHDPGALYQFGVAPLAQASATATP